MPQTSVPDNSVMKEQQAKDAPAKSRSKSRSPARSKAPSKPTATKASKTASAGKKATSKVASANATAKKAAPAKAAAKSKPANSKPKAAPAPVASGQGEIRSTAAPSSAAPRQETGSSWGLGKLLRIFSRSKGEKVLEKQADNSLGKNS